MGTLVNTIRKSILMWPIGCSSRTSCFSHSPLFGSLLYAAASVLDLETNRKGGNEEGKAHIEKTCYRYSSGPRRDLHVQHSGEGWLVSVGAGQAQAWKRKL